MSAYLAISDKLEQNPDALYPTADMVTDLAHLLLACRTLIQHNGHLSTQILDAEKKAADAIVACFEKDIEIHELKGNDL